MNKTLALLAVSAALLSACAPEVTTQPAASAPILEIALRYVTDKPNFDRLNDQLNATLTNDSGSLGAAEFPVIYSLAPQFDPQKPMQLGLGVWRSPEAFQQAAGRFQNDPVVAQYFGTIKSIQNVTVRPLKPTEKINLAELATPGNVLELAIRDISAYKDMKDFYAKKDAFLQVLKAQKGVIREYEWMSTDGKYYVGMTRYESPEAFQRISADPALLQNPAVGAMFAAYPPNAAVMTVPGKSYLK